VNRHDFDRFVADSTDGLLRTAHLIVWDLPEAEDLVRVSSLLPPMDRPLCQRGC
jgi:hypothetical protein